MASVQFFVHYFYTRQYGKPFFVNFVFSQLLVRIVLFTNKTTLTLDLLNLKQL